jgi:uncharacterized protein (DUF2141 family)
MKEPAWSESREASVPCCVLPAGLASWGPGGRIITYRTKTSGWMTRTTAAIAFFAAFCVPAGPLRAQSAAGLADLTVDVQGLSPKGGTLRMGLYNEARYPNDDSTPIASADVKAVGAEVKVTLHGVAPGTYAIQLFQDFNSNGKMDTTWMGLPVEPFGFSRDAHPFLSKPTFDEVKFTLAAGGNTQIIHLQNTDQASPQDKVRDQLRGQGLR